MPAKETNLTSGSLKKQLKAGTENRAYNPEPMNISGLMFEETRGATYIELQLLATEVELLLKKLKKSTVKAEYIEFIIERLGLHLDKAKEDFIPKSPIVRIFKSRLNEKYNVTADAANTLHRFVNDLVFTLGFLSARNAESHKRKTIFPRDMQLARKDIIDYTYELDECARKCVLDKFVK